MLSNVKFIYQIRLSVRLADPALQGAALGVSEGEGASVGGTICPQGLHPPPRPPREAEVAPGNPAERWAGQCTGPDGHVTTINMLNHLE